VREWTLDEATEALPRVRELVGRLRDLVGEHGGRGPHPSGNGRSGPSGNGSSSGSAPDSELVGVLRELDELGIVVRDPQRGLIDFPARSPSGREYLLCWLYGEDAIEWWHWPDAGFAGRTSLTEPPP
jgi:hypothetical protein